MSAIDWAVLLASLTVVTAYGVWKTRGAQNAESHLRGGTDGWVTVGLSVMATQASAITFLSGPGQAFTDGMGFVQMYLGLPLAMIVVSAVDGARVLPTARLHRVRVPGAALRSPHSSAHRGALLDPARCLHRHHDLRARDLALGGARLAARVDERAHRHRCHRLHGERWLARGEPDAEAADGRDPRRHDRRRGILDREPSEERRRRRCGCRRRRNGPHET